ncbi:MAG: hypothetical protein HYY46_08970, partial [Deltaproteobacteria bacterium]|nr:hypothetical protein [Deltaproteobacteria bacterium]
MLKKNTKKWGAFPRLSELVESTGSTEFVTAYRERLDAVDYHLGSLEIAAQQCSTHVDSQSWHIQEGKDGHHITVFFDPLSVVRTGDFAIREAASVIDTGLLVMNHVLTLGLDATQPLAWKSNNKRLSVRSALARQLPTEAKLLSVLDRVFGSIGYSLLRGYRNWVTHRGAPRIVPTKKTPLFPCFSYKASEEIVRENKPHRQKW